MKLGFYLFSFIFFSFATLNGQGIGIIGSATPLGWNEDIDLQQDVNDPQKWTIRIMLSEGECKFRQSDTWDLNWGGSTFPMGSAIEQGSNIVVGSSAEYFIEFHTGTGHYKFTHISDIGLIGSATPFGTAEAVGLVQDSADSNAYFNTLVLEKGTCHFQILTTPSTSWGSADFPEGIATLGGADIQIPIAGKYLIQFNRATGAFRFERKIEVISVQIIGDANPNSSTTNKLASSGLNEWSATTFFNNGNLRFQINYDEALNYGANFFPVGTAILDGTSIPVVAGEYRLDFNSDTKNYRFTPVDNYSSIGLIGSATTEGWNQDIDFIQDQNDKTQWYQQVTLTDGEVKFRADDNWFANWGNLGFPSDLGIRDGNNIVVLAGNYLASFNTATGRYNFEPFTGFPKIALLGDGTELANWSDEVLLSQDLSNPFLYKGTNIMLRNGSVKFRANQDWSNQWGAGQFPVGTGLLNGTNIPTQAGIYSVAFNIATGQYTFSTLTSSQDLNPELTMNLYPNPAADILTVAHNTQKVQGDTHIAFFDMQGRLVLEQSDSSNRFQIDISRLTTGSYTVRLTNQQQTVAYKIFKQSSN